MSRPERKYPVTDVKKEQVESHENNLQADSDIVVVGKNDIHPVPANRILGPNLRSTTYPHQDAWLLAQEGKGLVDPNRQQELLTSIGWQHIFWTEQMFRLAIKAHLRNMQLLYTKRDEMTWQKNTLFVVDIPNRQANHPIVPHWIDPIHLKAVWDNYCNVFCVEYFGEGNPQDSRVAPAVSVMHRLVTINVNPQDGSGSIVRQS